MSAIHRIRFRSLPRWAEIVADAAEASEVFGDDELERWAAEHPPTEAGVAHARLAYIEAAGIEAALPVIARQEPELIERAGLGWLPPTVTGDRRYQVAKLKFQTTLIMRRHRVAGRLV